jgi:hypothetical protein
LVVTSGGVAGQRSKVRRERSTIDQERQGQREPREDDKVRGDACQVRDLPTQGFDEDTGAAASSA